MTTTCRSCGAPIRWERTSSGKRIPLDADPARGGNVDVVWIGGERVAVVLGPADAAAAEVDGHVLYRAHFATCPDAATHRRRPPDPLS